MQKDQARFSGDQRWAHFRFSVIGPLLAAPPRQGDLKKELQHLAEKEWCHPINGQWVRWSVPTLERWYYRALQEHKDPVGVLARKIRKDHGTHPSLDPEIQAELLKQYGNHPSWSYQLHYDNLAVLAAEGIGSSPISSYGSLRRFMKAHGLFKRKRLGRGLTAGAQAAERRFESHEVRSYESEYVNALWHLDFHAGFLKVLGPNGQWVTPHLMGILDDFSRLCVHAQWYLAENSQNLVHGLCQGFEKHGLSRATMMDNGSAMTSAETSQGLQRLSVVQEKTLFYSPYQNGKQEFWWTQIEGRVLAMLEGCKDLSLALLNKATHAWVEMEYNRKRHSEIGQKPLERFVQGRDVSRPCPSSEELRLAFTAQASRSQRRSDGTLSLTGIRFEVPSRYRHLERLTVRFASWDLSHVYLCDGRSGQVLCRLYPQDKHKNADARRRRQEPILKGFKPGPSSNIGMAPLLKKLIADYAATGLPPAYLPKDECPIPKEKNS